MTDQEIIQGLIDRDDCISFQFFYVKCRLLLTAIMCHVFNYPVEYDEMVFELYDYPMQDDKELEENVDLAKEVIAIIDKNIVDGMDDKQQPLYHALYVTWVEDENVEYLNLTTLRDVRIDKEVFRKAWKSSGNYMVASSLDVNVYNPQPINVEDIDLDADLEELSEAIAENAYDIWARTRMDEGWTYGPSCNDLLKQHPDLVPYAKLHDTAKEYNWFIVMNTLRLVHRHGFDIINR